nr:MAG TPA: hypothetical protein [Caudoviricetes sp.]
MRRPILQTSSTLRRNNKAVPSFTGRSGFIIFIRLIIEVLTDNLGLFGPDNFLQLDACPCLHKRCNTILRYFD